MRSSATLVCVLAAVVQCSPAAAAVTAAEATTKTTTLLIENVTVIDGTARPGRAGQSVLIAGDRIVAIRDHPIHAPTGATVIDGHGRFLMPGMADTHIHLYGGRGPRGTSTEMDLDIGRRLLQGYLYDGVTFVCDVANYDRYIFALRDAERSGRLVSPRIFAVGYPLVWAGGYGAGGPGPSIGNYEEGVRVLDALLAEKPDLVKILYAPYVLDSPKPLPAFDPETLHRLILHANERGFRTTIHAVDATTQRAAVEAGIDALAHPVYMTETDDRLAPLIATRGLPVSTTLVVLTNIYTLIDHPDMFDTPGFRALLTEQDLAQLRDADRARYQRTHLDVWARQAFVHAATNVKKLYDAGATLALGTDRTVGEYVPEELELLVGLGIPPLQALRIATLNAAIYVHAADRMGSVEEGKLADLVLLDADPTRDIRNVRKVAAVILGGKIVDRASLELPVNPRAR